MTYHNRSLENKKHSCSSCQSPGSLFHPDSIFFDKVKFLTESIDFEEGYIPLFHDIQKCIASSIFYSRSFQSHEYNCVEITDISSYLAFDRPFMSYRIQIRVRVVLNGSDFAEPEIEDHVFHANQFFFQYVPDDLFFSGHSALVSNSI